MNKRRALSFFFLALTAGFGVYYFVRHGEDFSLITTISAEAIAVIALLRLSLILCHGLQVKFLTDHYGLGLDFSNWFGLSRIATFSNMLLPVGSGASIKAVYLKKIHGLNYSSFIVSNALALIIRILVTAFVASALAFTVGGRAGVYLLAISASIFIGASGFLLFAGGIRDRLGISWDYLRTLTQGWLGIRADHKLLWRLTVLNAAILALSSLEVFYSFRAFNIEVSAVASVIIASFTTFTAALRLTPANLGPKELVYASLAEATGLGANAGIHAAALSRIVGGIITVALAPGFAWKLSNKARGADPAEF